MPLVHIEGRAGDRRAAKVSGERAWRELGWRPETSFAEGVRRYVDWVTESTATPRAAAASRMDGTAAAARRHEPGEL